MGLAEFRLLGPVEARIGGVRADIGHARQRSVLAVLLVEANTVVPLGRLVERVWGVDSPETATGLVYGYVSRLRRRLDGTVSLLRVPGGYRLDAEPDWIDLHRFRHLVAAAWAAGDDARAAALLADALDLWRGTAFTGLASPWLEGLRRTLEHERLAAMVDHFEVQLRLGRDAGILGGLREVLACQPFDERAAGLFMLAAHQFGRRAEALECYHLLRRRLADDLGVEPGAPLQELFCQLLRDDPALTRRQGSPERPQPVPAQLPHDVASFAGRAAELGTLDRMFAGQAEPAGQAVVISAVGGVVGVGKTALAIHWAHRVASRFPDGQLFADLRGFAARRPVPPGEILGRFLRALGVSPQDVPVGVEERAAMYRSLLTGKRVLLVLDNALNTGQVRPLLPGSSGCLVLVTSRNRLSGLVALDGASQITLDPLAPDEAVALLGQVAGTGRVATEQEAARRICRLCGFLPLTVRMAAAQATARPGRALGELADELARPGQRLGLASDDELTTVRAMLSWSCRALSPEAARLFGLLGLHPGSSISTTCAAALAGIPEASARRQLQALASVHLLEESGLDRYRLPGLLHLYAAERSAGQPGCQRADALGRLLAWYLHTAAAASQILAPRPPLPLASPPPGVRPLPLHTQAQALAWFEAERASILAVTRQAADAGQHALAWQLPVTCWDFFYRRKHTADWLAASTVALASAQRAGDRYGEGWAWQSLGDAYRDLRRFSDAITHLERALAVRRQISDRQGEGWALANLGACYLDQRHYSQALGMYRQAATAERDAGDQWGLAISLTNSGEASRDLGRFRDAFTASQQALGIHRRLGDQHSEAWTLTNLASIYQRLHCWTEALGHAQGALAIQREIDDQWGQSITLTSLARIHDLTGQPAQAIDRYQQALNIQRDLADRHGQISILPRLAGILQRTRQPDAARACLRQASQLSSETGGP